MPLALLEPSAPAVRLRLSAAMAFDNGSDSVIAALAVTVAPRANHRRATGRLIPVLTFIWGLGRAFKRGESAFLAEDRQQLM
ncbi:hypothetical protein Axi01nite_34190 [Actinoplanes xinjiangensis]|nr:hypothetical protein Axi01nite_34190 [Actinoplanes xinjiangensis]